MTTDTHKYMTAWVSLVHLGSWLPEQLSNHFQARLGISLAEQDLLKQLDKSLGKLKMVELAQRIFLSKAGVSKMVNRLEKINLVKRQRSEADGRVFYVSMTPLGKRKLAKSWELIVPWVKSNFADRLPEEEMLALGSILENLLESHGRWEGQQQHLAPDNE